MSELLGAGVRIDFQKQIADLESQPQENQRAQDELYARLPIDAKHRHLLNVARDFVYQKSFSKENQYLAWYALDILLREMARRLFITVQQMRYFLPKEVKPALLENAFDVNELNERFRYSLLCFDSTGSYVVTGEAAKTMRAELNLQHEEVHLDANEFRGQAAVPGSARGMVKIINSPSDMEKMQKGDVLVSEMTVPEIVAAMKKASAIVTDMGGITCHAAIVSRELGIPCVIGTKVATRILKDGDMVEVDAVNGVVKKV